MYPSDKEKATPEILQGQGAVETAEQGTGEGVEAEIVTDDGNEVDPNFVHDQEQDWGGEEAFWDDDALYDDETGQAAYLYEALQYLATALNIQVNIIEVTEYEDQKVGGSIEVVNPQAKTAVYLVWSEGQYNPLLKTKPIVQGNTNKRTKENLELLIETGTLVGLDNHPEVRSLHYRQLEEAKHSNNCFYFALAECLADNKITNELVGVYTADSLKALLDEVYKDLECDKTIKKLESIPDSPVVKLKEHKLALSHAKLSKTGEDAGKQKQETRGEKIKAAEQQDKAKAVRGYYSNDDVTILLDGLLRRNEFERIRGGNEQDIVKNLQTGANTRTMVLAPIAENSEEAVVQLSMDISRAHEQNIEQVLVPMNIPNIHWYTIQLKLLPSTGGYSVEATIHDPLGIRKTSVVVDRLASQGIIVTKQIEGNLPKIQRGEFGAKNVYCGGYTARLMANLVLDHRIVGEVAWGCPCNLEQSLREEDVDVVNDYNSDKAGNFGKESIAAREIMKSAQDMSLLRDFIAREKEVKLLQDFTGAYKDMPIETKLSIESANIPGDPAGLFAFVRDLYVSIPAVLKVLFQTNAEGEIEKTEDDLLKVDTTIEVEQIQKILIKLQMTCLKLEGIETNERREKEVELEEKLKAIEARRHNVAKSFTQLADKSKGLNEAPQEGLSEVWLFCKGNYHTEDVSMDIIDRWLKELRQNEKKIAYVSTPKGAQVSVSTYNYRDTHKALVSRKTMTHLKDKVRTLLYRHDAELSALIEASIVKQEIAPYLVYREVSESKFIGRPKELKAIQDALASTQVLVVIKGVAGVGKTSIVRHYVHILKDYTPVWLDADSQISLAMSYRSFGESLGLNLDMLEEDTVMRLVHNKISSSEQKILFIFDNLKGGYANHYVRNLPKNVKLLIATRHEKRLADFGQEIRLDPFGQQEAHKYLADHGIKQEDVELLVKEIGSIPQHLSLAVGYLKNNRAKTVQDIVSDLKEKTIFEITLGQLTEEHEVEWELLQYMSCLDPDFIPEDVLLEIAVGDKGGLWKAIEKLENLSLIRVIERATIGVQVSREVQDEMAKYITKYHNKSNDQIKLVERLLQVLNKILPYITNNTNKGWTKARLYLSSLQSVFEHINSRKINLVYNPDIAALNEKLGEIYAEMLVDFKKALDYKKQALKIRQALYPSKNHPDVAISLSSVGLAYEALGDAKSGLDYLERSLKMVQILYPSGNHPVVAAALSNVGIAYETLGDAEKSLDYCERSLKINQALYPSGNHPAVAASLCDVGIAYGALGDTKKSLDYQERSLKIRQALYPSGNHHDVAASLSYVGLAYEASGDVRRGLDYLERSLTMRLALYIGDHPDVAASLNDVGLAYKLLGYVRKGLDYMERSLTMRQALYPSDHPAVATSLDNVGIAYEVLGEVKKGLSYQKRSLKIRQAIHPSDHPDVALSLNNVGIAYEILGELRNGLDYCEHSLKINQALYPSGNHPDVATSLNNVGLAYEALGDVKKGLGYLERSLDMRWALYLGDHPDVAISLSNVGLAYQALGDVSRGLDYLERSLKMSQALYKLENRPDVAASLSNVGSAYKALGDAEKSLDYQERSLEMRQVLYPGDHPAVASSLNSVGLAHEVLGDKRKRLEYFERSTKMRQALYPLGNHPTVAISMGNVGIAYKALGKVKKNRDYQEHNLKMRQALYTSDHPDFASSMRNVDFVYETLGRVQKGLDYQKHSLKMRQALYPSGNHPAVAISLRNVGLAYKTLGDMRNGLDYQGRSLQMRQVLEGNQPDIANSLSDVGIAYYELGDMNKSLDYHKLSLKMRQALYPSGNHHDVAISLSNVGIAYQALGDVRIGLSYLELSLKMKQTLYPEDNRAVATSLENVGLAYKDLGDARNGLDYCERGLSMTGLYIKATTLMWPGL